MKLLKPLIVCGYLLSVPVWAQTDCRPFNPEDAKVVDRGPVKSVTGPLATFDPCHKSVRLDQPSLFAQNRSERPPLIIVVHGGVGIDGYTRNFAKLMNDQGFTTLMFDAFEMNGFAPRSDLLRFMTTGGRQKMLYKATWGAYQWVIQRKDLGIDINKIYFYGISNGASVAINMASSVDPANVRGIIAEGAPSSGIGFPNEIKVPLLLIYGLRDNYGGIQEDDWMHLRAWPCSRNDPYPLAPAGFAQTCNPIVNRHSAMPSPQIWYQGIKAKGQDIRMELVEGGGHGMLFDNFRSSATQLANGRWHYASHGAPIEAREKLKTLILNFIEARL